MIATLLGGFEKLRHGLAVGFCERAAEFFDNAKQRRDHWCGQTTSPSPE